MRQLLISLFLLSMPLAVLGEMGSFDVEVIKLTENGNNEYTFRFIQLSQPFGYTHKQDEEIVVHLRFQCPVYQCLEEDNQPTEKTFNAAISLLKQQITASKRIKFGVIDRGYAKISGTKNEYQSNTLYIREGIVCSDYDFFDF